jgi:hypothetical protein
MGNESMIGITRRMEQGKPSLHKGRVDGSCLV